MNDVVLAVDLGGTKCSGAVINRSGKTIAKNSVKLEGREGADVGTLILDLANKLLQESAPDIASIRGIGVSVPGISYHSTGCVWAPNIPGWENYPLLSQLENQFGDHIRIAIDSDRVCCILGETWLGAAKGSENVIFLAVGTGIGAGILINGNIIRGTQDIAGAIGWMALETEYIELYRKFGCFEYHASGDGLVREAIDILENNSIEKSTTMKEDEVTTSRIFKLYHKNDPVAKKVIHRAIGLWGKAVANLVSLLNPEIIIFGGGVFGPALVFLDEIKKESIRWAQPLSIQQVKLTGSELKEDAALFGAANLIFNDL